MATLAAPRSSAAVGPVIDIDAAARDPPMIRPAANCSRPSPIALAISSFRTIRPRTTWAGTAHSALQMPSQSDSPMTIREFMCPECWIAAPATIVQHHTTWLASKRGLAPYLSIARPTGTTRITIGMKIAP